MSKYKRKGGWGGAREGAGRKANISSAYELYSKRYDSIQKRDKTKRQTGIRVYSAIEGSKLSKEEFNDYYQDYKAELLGLGKKAESKDIVGAIIEDSRSITKDQAIAQARNLKSNIQKAIDKELSGENLNDIEKLLVKSKSLLKKDESTLASGLRNRAGYVSSVFDAASELGAYSEAFGS